METVVPQGRTKLVGLVAPWLGIEPTESVIGGLWSPVPALAPEQEQLQLTLAFLNTIINHYYCFLSLLLLIIINPSKPWNNYGIQYYDLSLVRVARGHVTLDAAAPTSTSTFASSTAPQGGWRRCSRPLKLESLVGSAMVPVDQGDSPVNIGGEGAH